VSGERSLGAVVKAMADVGRTLRQDGWRATLSGIGGRRDKARHVKFCPTLQLDREVLAGVYRDSWLVRRIITAVPEEALRRGFGEELDADDLPEFTRLNFERYPGEGALVRACNLARLMGGAGIYIGYRDGGADLTQPAREGAEVSFLEVFHRYELQAVEGTRVLDPSDPRYGRPEQWEVIGQNRTHLRFHHSRMIIFPGQPRADNFETVAGADRDWDDSVLQSMWEDVARYGLFWQSVSHLMQISSVGVLKIDGLIQMLTSQDQADAEARIDLINEALSLTRLMMLDAAKGEEYRREAVSFTDVPALLQELQLATAGAVEMPVTVLFGRAPAGMNATGESDLRTWYDTVDTWRERVLKPRAEQLIGACERRADIAVDWPPLWEPTEKECAEVSQIKTNRLERLWSMGVASDAEIRQSLFEHKAIEDLLQGPPPAEPTRAVTQIAVVAPGENPAAPIDPEAADAPAPAKPATPFPGR
jgi:phage-related protein (TIGR01555 family)